MTIVSTNQVFASRGGRSDVAWSTEAGEQTKRQSAADGRREGIGGPGVARRCSALAAITVLLPHLRGAESTADQNAGDEGRLVAV